MTRYAWIVLAVFFALGESRSSHSDETTNCVNMDVDVYMAKVVDQARKELDDPMPLSPRSAIIFRLEDGQLWGFSSLKMVGKATVTCHGNGITIVAKLSAEETIKGRYTWIKSRGEDEDPLKGNIVFMSSDFQAEITLYIEKIEGEVTHPIMEKFVIEKFKDAKIEMTGLGLFGWTLAEITSRLSPIFQRAIAHTIQGPITEALERQLREVDLE